MTIHLIRSEGFAQQQYWEVVEFLQSFAGPVQFMGAGPPSDFPEEAISMEPVDEDEFFKQEPSVMYSMEYHLEIPLERPEASWADLFDLCQQYREKENLPQSDLVILLTDVANDHNWFCALDPKNPCSGFVHTDDWKHYVQCSEVFPVAYLVASWCFEGTCSRTCNRSEMQFTVFPWAASMTFVSTSVRSS